MARKYPKYSIFFVVVMIVMAIGLLWSASSEAGYSAVVSTAAEKPCPPTIGISPFQPGGPSDEKTGRYLALAGC